VIYTQSLRRGALFAVASAFLFATMGACIKWLSTSLPTEMVVFFRNFASLLLLLPWLSSTGIRALATHRLRLHLTRSLAGLTAMYCYFYVLAHMPLAEAVLLNYSAPLFIPLIAHLWLGEVPSTRVYGAVATGFLGIALILKPGADLFQAVGLVGLVSGLFAALAVSGVRRMSSSEPTTRIVFYFSLIASLVSALPLFWSWQPPLPWQWGLLLATGLLATGGQWLMTRAYALAPAARIAPFTYASVVFAALYGALFWQESLDLWSGAGALLIFLAGSLTARRAAIPPVADDVGTTPDRE
jgi:drug/metabolite transporter (DMT)-like permease